MAPGARHNDGRGCCLLRMSAVAVTTAVGGPQEQRGSQLTRIIQLFPTVCFTPKMFVIFVFLFAFLCAVFFRSSSWQENSWSNVADDGTEMIAGRERRTSSTEGEGQEESATALDDLEDADII